MHLYVDFPDVRVCGLTSLTVSVYGQGTEGPRCFAASVARPSLPVAEKDLHSSSSALLWIFRHHIRCA